MCTKAAVTAFRYERVLLKVTRPEPIGYLFLSVSMPESERGQRQLMKQPKNCLTVEERFFFGKCKSINIY